MDDNHKINIQVSSSILDNSFDILFSAVEIIKPFNDKTHSSVNIKELKAGLITTITGVELILKSKIASIDWKLLFQNVKDADIRALYSGDFKSVNFDSCLKIIEQYTSIRFDKRTKDNIEDIRKIRNKIVHYYTTDTQTQLIAYISVGLDVFIEFYRSYIFNDFCEEVDRTNHIEYELKCVQEFVRSRLLTLKEKYKNFKRPNTPYFSECSSCLQDAFIILDKETVRCVFCGKIENIKQFTMDYSSLENQVRFCPNCKFESMAASHLEDEEDAWDCVICGFFINKSRKWKILI